MLDELDDDSLLLEDGVDEDDGVLQLEDERVLEEHDCVLLEEHEGDV